MKAMKDLVMLVLIIFAMIGALLTLRACAESRLDPWCRSQGYSHGRYAGGSHCVKQDGTMVRVDYP